MSVLWLLVTLLAPCVSGSLFTYEKVDVGNSVQLNVGFAGPHDNHSDVIVFLHGFPEGSWSWHGMVSHLMDVTKGCTFRFVAPDLRGYNRSSKPSEVNAYEVKLISADVVALIRATVGIHGRVHVVSHDWGGAIGWWLATYHSDMVLTNTVINMAHPYGWASLIRTDPKQQSASAYVLSAINPNSTKAMTANDYFGLKMIFRAESWWNADSSAYVSSWSQPGGVDKPLDWYRANIHPHCPLSCVVASCWKQGLDTTFDQMPLHVTPPTLVLWGMKDDAFDGPGQLNFIRHNVTGMPGLKINEYPDNTHWLAQEIPRDVAVDWWAFVQTFPMRCTL